jgi:1-phosphofructokinase family hexose kinase
MILTVTANSALDKVMFIDEFRPTSVMRSTRLVESVGGKGLDASVVLQALGVHNVALGFVAGPSGERLVQLLDGYNIQHDLIWVAGQTRTAHVVVETHFPRHSHIIAGGYSVSPQDVQALLERYRHHLREAIWVLCGGSLPPGAPSDLYRTLSTLADQAGVPMLIDCPREPLRQALPARPTIVKMNRHELRQTFGLVVEPRQALLGEAQQLRQSLNLPNLVITCGQEGILALTAQGSYLAASPPQPVVNAAGAGDAVSAALAWRLSLGEGWPEALRWAAAAGAAVVLTEGTADCQMEDVQRLYLQTVIQPVS